MQLAEFKFCLLTMEKRSSVLQRELSGALQHKNIRSASRYSDVNGN